MSPVRMSKVESGVRVVLAFSEAFNRHDVTAMVELVTDDCVLEQAVPAPDGAIHTGKDALAHYWQDFFETSSQASLRVEEILGFGLHCVMRWRCDWVDAAGNAGHLRSLDLFEIRGGLICKIYAYVKGQGDDHRDAPSTA